MSKNRFELDPERLASTDEFGNRVYIHPEDVNGKWKQRRFPFYYFLVFIYLVLPWIYINGKPSLLIDIAKREFTVMGQTLYGVEPILFFLLLVSGLFYIAFVTSTWGRAWCGWGCPQTVFTQGIFLKIESWVEGKARERINLDAAPWSVSKIIKKSIKWLIFFIISAHIAHTFIGYFVGPRELFQMTIHSPHENWGVFVAAMILTTIFLLDFGWFREQFCIIACPYGRIQSVMMDEHSKVVGYDVKRGEPRRGTEGVAKEQEGDCVNCYSCVKVCPTGIDIRRGAQQLECIACTQCIDACDDIMTRLKRPTGLIRYTTELELRGETTKKRNLRPYVYASFCITFVAAFFFFLNRSTIPALVFMRGVGAPYLVSDLKGEKIITNKFNLKVKHQGTDQHAIKLVLNPHLHKDELYLSDVITIQISENPIKLNVPEKKLFVFFKFPYAILNGGTKVITLDVVDVNSLNVLTQKEVTLVGPVHE